jgi:2-dehydropantoate 2-reductase
MQHAWLVPNLGYTRYTACSWISMPIATRDVAFNRRSAKTHSGVWRDLAVRKRRTEAEHQLGPIVSHGQHLGVPTPMTTRLIELIHEIENGVRPQDMVNLDALKALI